MEGVKGISVAITGHRALTEVGRGPRKADIFQGSQESCYFKRSLGSLGELSRWRSESVLEEKESLAEGAMRTKAWR